MLRHCKPVVLQDMREAQKAIWTNFCADALNHFGDMRTSLIELSSQRRKGLWGQISVVCTDA
ncbi:hypothetical protein DBR45_16720 [Pseudomonas sp. HMWF031]|nr:hypothetical protein DBR45_16720 [Pseudomonas sp. HMWF031]